MKIAVGSDHAGYELKRHLVDYLAQNGNAVTDVGPDSDSPVDYPDYAVQVAEAVVSGKADRGVLVCGAGIGMSIAANKVPGVRAALCNDEYTAEVSRRHNDANIVVLPGRIVANKRAERIVSTWLKTPFDGGRHEKRIAKITALEEKTGKRNA